MLPPRTPLPPQSNPAALLRQSTTNRIANTLQGQRPAYGGQPVTDPALIGPPVQQPPTYGTNPIQPGTRPPSFGQSPQPWMTYEMLMRSAKPGIEHIAQQAAQGQRGTGSNWLPLSPGRPGSTSDVQPPGGSWLPLSHGMQGGTPGQWSHPGQAADWYQQLMRAFGHA